MPTLVVDMPWSAGRLGLMATRAWPCHPPVFDGLIAAAGRLLMSTTDGRVVCFGPQ
ncbi:MAG: hypothetical protein ACYTG0_29455 [Planctomycetota bacterium]